MSAREPRLHVVADSRVSIRPMVEFRPLVAFVQFAIDLPILRVAPWEGLGVVGGDKAIRGHVDGLLTHKLHEPLAVLLVVVVGTPLGLFLAIEEFGVAFVARAARAAGSRGQVIDFFSKKFVNSHNKLYLCSVFVESLNLVLCQESQENQAEQASIM